MGMGGREELVGKAVKQRSHLTKALKAEQKFVKQRSIGRSSGRPSPDKGTELRHHLRLLGSYFREAGHRAEGFSSSQYLKGLECHANELDPYLKN